MKATTLVAWRYLFSSRERFVPFLSLVSVFGILLGVFSIILVSSLMSGFERELSSRWIGLNSHLTIQNLHLNPNLKEAVIDWIQKNKRVQETYFSFEGEAIVESDSKENPIALGVRIKGVQELSGSVREKVDFFPPLQEEWKGDSVFVGEELLFNLGMVPDFQQKLKILYPLGEIGPSGDWVPRTLSLPIQSIFHSGIYVWDSHTLILPMEAARSLLGEGGSEEYHVLLSDWKEVKNFKSELAYAFPDLTVTTFAEQNKRLFSALKLEQWGMNFLLLMFILIASFSITGLLLMFVYSKSRDVAILKSIGFSAGEIRKLFIKIGFIIGGSGSLLGGILASATLLFLKRYPIRLPASYYLDYLPVDFQIMKILLFVLLGFLLTLFSALYPVQIAKGMEPVPMLREE